MKAIFIRLYNLYTVDNENKMEPKNHFKPARPSAELTKVTPLKSRNYKKI